MSRSVALLSACAFLAFGCADADERGQSAGSIVTQLERAEPELTTSSVSPTTTRPATTGTTSGPVMPDAVSPGSSIAVPTGDLAPIQRADDRTTSEGVLIQETTEELGGDTRSFVAEFAGNKPGVVVPDGFFRPETGISGLGASEVDRTHLFVFVAGSDVIEVVATGSSGVVDRVKPEPDGLVLLAIPDGFDDLTIDAVRSDGGVVTRCTPSGDGVFLDCGAT